MSVLRNPFGGGGTQHADFTPISATLNNLQAGAGTIAAVWMKDDDASSFDITGLVNTGLTQWYHALRKGTGAGDPFNSLQDDDGIVMNVEGGGPWSTAAPTYYIAAVTWAAGTVTERFHRCTVGGSWTHNDADTTNGGNRVGPGTSSGVWRIGHFGDGGSTGNIALCAAWVGTALSDAQVEELSANSRTSDWWNNSAAHPTLLIECNTSTPTDIGADPSTFSTIGGMTLTGADPAWTFNGRGAAVVTDSLPRPEVRTSRGISWG